MTTPSSGPAQFARPSGYHKLADMMGPYQEVAIFRRFGPLNMLNLLSLQSELVELNARFRISWAEDDGSSDPDEKEFSVYFRKLRESEGGGQDNQYQMLLQIREKLKEYNPDAAILQVSQLASLPKPSKSNLKFLRGWLSGEDEGKAFLQGSECFTWDSRDGSSEAQRRIDKDLVALHVPVAEQDAFSQEMTSKLLDWYHYLWGSRSKRRKLSKTIDEMSGVMYYDNDTLLRINTVIVSVLSSALPVVAIVVLYSLKTMVQRIGTVIAFTILFAFVLATFTNARRLEIFASTSAFAAVEVVFIGVGLPSIN